MGMQSPVFKHVIVYRESGRYAGWPANYGIWSWGDEIVVVFTVGYHNSEGRFHYRDKDRPFSTQQARSTDGGQNWKVDPCPCRTPDDRGISADEHMEPNLGAGYAITHSLGNGPKACPGGIQFRDPSFAMLCARTGLGTGTVSWFYISYDRCSSWEGPYSLPDFGLPGIEARTDYQVEGNQECILFLTASKPWGGEGHGVFCARTTDSGASFKFVGWVTPQIDRGFAIMPASVRLSGTDLLVAVRGCLETQVPSKRQHFIDLYASKDNGRNWHFISRPVADTGRGGNPPTLMKLTDGRMCLTYGFRGEPYGIHARLSSDEGQSWGETIILRNDGGSHDLGYTRTVQRPDGRIVTVYYFNDGPGKAGYIAATIWQPPD